MDDKTLVERVIAWLDGGCSSWNVPSSDIRKMATRIEALEAVLRIEIWNGLKRNGMSDDAATAMVKERMAALESQP